MLGHPEDHPHPPQPQAKIKQSPPVVLAERKNRAEAEALKYRIGFLEWRQRHLMTKYDFQAEDIKKNAKILAFTSGKSQHSEACASHPPDYPKLHLRTEYVVPVATEDGGFHTPEPVKERTDRSTLKWDQKSFRTLLVPTADEELFSMANMHRWRGKGQDFGRHAKYLNLPTLDTAAAVRSYKRGRALTRFLAIRARNCSGRLKQLYESQATEESEAEGSAALAAGLAARTALAAHQRGPPQQPKSPVQKLKLKMSL